MGWIGGTFTISYDEIMQHLFDDCRSGYGPFDKHCIKRKMERLALENKIYKQKAERLKSVGIDPRPTPAEWRAFINWQRARYGGNTLAEMYLGQFERDAARYALATKGRVSVGYGSAMPTSYEVTIEGPRGTEREFETENYGVARAIQREAERLFGKNRPENLEDERELMKMLEELFERYRSLF